MVENLPCHMHLRIDKRRDAKRNEAKKMAGRIRYAQPFPPYNPIPPFFSPKKYRSGFFLASLRLKRSGREYKKYRSGFSVPLANFSGQKYRSGH